jgi:glucose/arabinose dehydrogenase
LYIALTDRLIRYRYQDGDQEPQSAPQVLAKFPDYGLSYKYGGWHLTRTVAISDQKVYVAVGSSCNSCEEKEAIRAAIVEMNFDGSQQKPFAQGLRDAVGIKWVNSHLFATNMGADHLGDNQPDETFYRLKPQQHYGFPYCFEYRAKIHADPQYQKAARRIPCADIPLADVTFPAHSAPLGLEYFDATHSTILQDSFLVALHGSSKRSLSRGYTVVQVRPGKSPEPFITGFLKDGTIYGRPVDIFTILRTELGRYDAIGAEVFKVRMGFNQGWVQV